MKIIVAGYWLPATGFLYLQKLLSMRKFLILIILASLYACNSGTEQPEGPVVAVSILPQKYLVSSIADTLVDVVVMVPPGASPATWEATSAQMKSLQYASIYFRIGHIGFEKAWMDRISELNEQMLVVDLADKLELIQADYQHGDHMHVGTDPHTWMSAKNMESMARTVYGSLSKQFPEYTTQFRSNYQNLMSEIKNTEKFLQQQLEGNHGSSFLVFHPSLAYLAKDFGLRQYAIEYEGKEPSPAHLKKIIDLARRENINTIFVQEEFDMRNAQIIAEEIGGKVVRINPLSENWTTEIKSTSGKLKKSFQ